MAPALTELGHAFRPSMDGPPLSADSNHTDTDSDCQSLLQQFHSTVHPVAQLSLSDQRGASDGGEALDLCDQTSFPLTPEHNATSASAAMSSTGEGLDLTCVQSSRHLTAEDYVTSGNAAMPSIDAGDLSPGACGLLLSQPSSTLTSNSTEAATAATRDDINCPNVNTSEDDSGSEPVPALNKMNKCKGSLTLSGSRRRENVSNYQAMTPWTNENLWLFPSRQGEMTCLPLNPLALREQNMNSPSPVPLHIDSVARRLGTALTDTVYSQHPTSPSPSQCSQGLKRAWSGQLDSFARQKRFKRTAHALQKCGLWDIAMKTGDLIHRNSQLQRDIQRFRSEAAVFLKAVVENPENRNLKEALTVSGPLTFGRIVRVADRSSLDCAVSSTQPQRCTSSHGNSSTTSGYTSFTEVTGKHSVSPSKQ